MQKELRELKDDERSSTATTAHHMADAVSFLMRVSDHAGMHSVTKKLEVVRGKLRRIEMKECARGNNNPKDAKKGIMQ
jgi:hypothetical protein